MKLTTQRCDILAAVSDSLIAVENKTTLPILANILIEAGPNGCFVTGTCLETAIRARFEATVESAGSITIPAKKFHAIIRESAKESTITIDVNDENHWVNISFGSARFKISGLSAEDFPVLPSTDDFKMDTFDSKTVLAMVSKVYHSVSNDQTRLYLAGIFVETQNKNEKNTLRMVATDGHRLALVEQEVDEGIDLSAGYIIPAKAIQVLNKMCEGNEKIEMGFHDKRNMVVTNNTSKAIIRLIEADFPDYSQVIPKGIVFKTSINRQELISAAKRMILISSEINNGVSLLFKNGTLTVKANNPDIGESSEGMDIQNQEGVEIPIGMNAKYLIEALSTFTDDEVDVHLTDSLTPMKITPIMHDNQCNVIMPMRL